MVYIALGRCYGWPPREQWMTMPLIRLTKAQADDLAVVCGKGLARLRLLASRLEESEVTISPTKLQELIAGVVEEDSAVIARQLIAWASLARRSRASPSEVVSALSESLKTLPTWEGISEGWEECKPGLERLLGARPVVIAAKALDLSFDFPNYCMSAQIITDARPVFSEAALPGEEQLSVAGAVVLQTLRLEYASRDGNHSISVTLDRDDIERLREACDRALQKGEFLIKLVRERWGLEAFSVGEENYGIL